MLGDAAKAAEPLSEETVAVLAVVDVCVAESEVVVVVDREVCVDAVAIVDIIVDSVLIGAENDVFVRVGCDVFVSCLQILTDEKAVLTVAAADERQDWRFVSVERSASLFERPRSRGSSCSRPFSPATT